MKLDEERHSEIRSHISPGDSLVLVARVVSFNGFFLCNSGLSLYSHFPFFFPSSSSFSPIVCPSFSLVIPFPDDVLCNQFENSERKTFCFLSTLTTHSHNLRLWLMALTFSAGPASWLRTRIERRVSQPCYRRLRSYRSRWRWEKRLSSRWPLPGKEGASVGWLEPQLDSAQFLDFSRRTSRPDAVGWWP